MHMMNWWGSSDSMQATKENPANKEVPLLVKNANYFIDK